MPVGFMEHISQSQLALRIHIRSTVYVHFHDQAGCAILVSTRLTIDVDVRRSRNILYGVDSHMRMQEVHRRVEHEIYRRVQLHH